MRDLEFPPAVETAIWVVNELYEANVSLTNR